MRRVADKYGLRKHCRFHTSLDKVEWDADANVWRIETCDVRTGEKQLTRATALVSAMGALVVPKFPKLEGIDSFKGEVFHSAQWRHDVDLRGKCVGVLGNGSSAYVDFSLNRTKCTTPLRSQFIPVISKDPTVTVVNFARTRMWYLPSVSLSSQKRPLILNLRYTKPLAPYWDITKWVFAHIPLVQRVHRFMIAASVCSLSILFRLVLSLTQHAVREDLSCLQSKRQQLREQIYDEGNIAYVQGLLPSFRSCFDWLRVLGNI